MFKIKLHPFYNMDGDIGGSPSVEGTVETVSTEIASEQETLPEVTTETADSESSFAKRLREHSDKAVRAEREKWEQETSEKYKDYETHKELSNYLQQVNGLDAMTLKERIEYEKLQEKAEANNISPEMQKRLESLEAKASKADELEYKQQEDHRVQSYFGGLNEFVKDKGIEADQLNQFMIENGLQYDPSNMEKSFNIAHKAMKADDLEKKLATAKEDSIKEYLASKKGPKVDGSSGSIVTEGADTSKMSWKQIEQRTAARLAAAKTPQ